MTYTAAVVTVSDRGAAGERTDTSAPALVRMLEDAGFADVARRTIPDDFQRISDTLRDLAARGTQLVVTTGGTGLGPRDVTPEATQAVIDREVPGLAELMRAAGRVATPMADLSRSVVGLRFGTLIVNVPGSQRAATESLAAVLPVLPHALALVGGDTEHREDATTTRPQTGRASHAATADDHGGPRGHAHDEACALAHDDSAAPTLGRLVAVYATPVSRYLLHWGRELGFRTVLVEPDAERIGGDHRASAHEIVDSVGAAAPDDATDVVVTDHDAPDLVEHLAAALATPARSIGLMGSRRHAPPHVDPLRRRGLDEATIARIQRPIGLDIGSRTPPEIALATLAGLVADRRGRAGRTVVSGPQH